MCICFSIEFLVIFIIWFIIKNILRAYSNSANTTSQRSKMEYQTNTSTVREVQFLFNTHITVFFIFVYIRKKKRKHLHNITHIV